MTDEYFANIPNVALTADEMWKVVNKEGANNWGVPGYEAPRRNIDHKQIKYDRENWEMHSKVWFKNGHYPPPKGRQDKDGKPIVPEKKNFIDDYINQAHSNFSKAKFDSYVEFLKGKGKTLEEVEGTKPFRRHGSSDNNKDVGKSKLYKHDRSTYLADISKDEKKKATVPEHLQEIITKVKEKQGRYASPDKSESEMMMVKYKGKTSISKADRLTILADCEHVGEKIPFYNTKPEEGSDAEAKKKNKHLFFPDKLVTMEKSPSWKICKPIQVDRGYLERRDDQQKEKVENLKKSWENRRVKFIDDVSLSYFQTQEGHKVAYKYKKPLEKPQQYALAKETNPLKYPGPQQYFKTPIVDLKKSPKNNRSDNEEQVAVEGSPKVYYSNRDKTDKKIFKPMRSYVF